ncbi:MAG: hypothetical protein AAF152_07060 [Cyanobacteria bacterium P01_A01_bin.114]
MSAQPTVQYAATGTYSRNILGPAFFEMSDLKVAGTAGLSISPEFTALTQSPCVVTANETLTVKIQIKFNKSPLTSLLMCLGTDVYVRFVFEGVGGDASEKDVEVMLTTVQDQYAYELIWTGTPQRAQMKPGLYAIASVAQIGPVRHDCSQPIIGYGYLAGALLQVCTA